MKTLARLLPLHAACLAAALLPAAARAAVPPAAERESLALYLADDQLVESATRAPKPLAQVAENVTVVTAREIEAMNAHTLADVLNRVTGVFVQTLTSGRFGDVAVAHIQGSGQTDFRNFGTEERHVTVLLDGVPMTQIASGAVHIQTIPVGIIDRIEILKGPASATWGSALSGVINVLTKKAGAAAVPQGSLYGSYGERRTYDARGEAAGAVGPIGYYLNAAAQGAHWQTTGTDYAAPSFFGKVEARPGRDLTFGVTVVSSRPEYEGENNAPLSLDYGYPTLVASASADARLPGGVTLRVAGFFQRLEQYGDTAWDGTALAPGIQPPAGERALLQKDRERNWGLNSHATWAAGIHTVTAGAEYFKSRVKNEFENGPTLADVFGFERSGDASTTFERWGAFVNDTVRLGPLTVTAGLRFDDTSKTSDFWSPSLGATLRLGSSTLLRAHAGRGFTTPPIAYLAGNAMNPPNSRLKAEKVWAWQGGVETTVVPALRLKLTAFRHEVEDSLESAPETGDTVNWDAVWRHGAEAEAETASFGGLSAAAGYTWVWVKRVGMERDQDLHQANLGLRYTRGTFRADLFGHWVWWDLGPGAGEGDKNDFLWDLTASKTVLSLGPVEVDLFGGVHNLFNGRQHTDDLRNPNRWVEGGVRLRF